MLLPWGRGTWPRKCCSLSQTPQIQTPAWTVTQLGDPRVRIYNCTTGFRGCLAAKADWDIILQEKPVSELTVAKLWSHCVAITQTLRHSCFIKITNQTAIPQPVTHTILTHGFEARDTWQGTAYLCEVCSALQALAFHQLPWGEEVR
jgi:hypothetical protein